MDSIDGTSNQSYTSPNNSSNLTRHQNGQVKQYNDIDLVKVLQTIMNMFFKGSDRYDVFCTILDHVMKVTNSNSGFVGIVTKKDNKHIHEIVCHRYEGDMSNDVKVCKELNRDHIIVNSKTSQYTSLLDRVVGCNTYIIVNRKDINIDYKNLPKDHMKIKNLLGIPLKLNNNTLGTIILCNRTIDGGVDIDFVDDVYLQIEPYVDVAKLIFNSYYLGALLSIYDKIVHNLTIPIIVYQSIKSYNSDSEDIKNYLTSCRCIIANKCFLDKVSDLDKSHNNVNVQNKSFFETFPNVANNQTILSCIKQMLTDKSNTNIESIVYEDYYLNSSEYQFKFCYVDDFTFIMSVDDIAKELLAKQVADNVAKSKEEFISNVSHEMRTPLNGILGYTALILDTPLTEYQRDCFLTIKECSMNLLYRVNDLLDLSKLTAGKMELFEEDFSLPDCISISYDVNSIDAKKKNIEMAYFIEPDVPNLIRGDSHKLQQILVNLLSNAIKFTDKGKINTHIKLVNDETTHSKLDIKNRYTLEFKVSDTGVGIKQDDIPKLFQTFSQLENSNDKITYGTGLGLVITKKLCELMGGSIRVESVYGKGSSFIFTVKLKGNLLNEVFDEDDLDAINGKKVLVVDDNEMNRVMVCSFLSDWHASPISCSSAKEAIMYIERNIIEFDLAIIDIRMPHKDGHELAIDIHNIKPDLPLIALSSALSPTNQSNHFKYYLTKPIKQKNLKQICINLFKNSMVQHNTTGNIGTISTTGTTGTIGTIKNTEPSHSRSQFSFTHSLLKLKDSRKSSNPVNLNQYNINSSNSKIILAEDIYINQKVTVDILRKIGYSNVDVVDDGIKLIEKIKSKSSDYDLILMDIKMPYMDGYQTAIAVSELYKTNDYKHRIRPRIIALTARVMSGVKEKCIESGMDDYLSKPIDIDTLQRKIEHTLSKSSSKTHTSTSHKNSLNSS